MISDDVIALNRQPSGQAKNDDAGQDHHRNNAGDTTIEATAREMTGHWFNSDSLPRLTASYDNSSAGRRAWCASRMGGARRYEIEFEVTIAFFGASHAR
jgi:hypothetical protein